MTILSEAPEIDAKVIDGASTIKMLKPTYSKTSRDYVINTSVSYISSLLRQVERMDLVQNRYFAEGLKKCTREKRRVGVCREVISNCLFPTNWMTFLRCSENKAEFFSYL